MPCLSPTGISGSRENKMLSFILFPLMIFCIFNLVFIRGFSRSTGLPVLPGRVFAYFLAGVILTLTVYLLLLLFDGLFGDWYDVIRPISSPVLEDLLKILLLSLLSSRVYISGEALQIYRQRLLAGIFLGLSFGLVETYLQSLVQSDFGPLLLGSIPLQMVVGGSIGIALSSKGDFLPRKVLFLLIILGHLLYNQGLRIPGPITWVSLIALLIASLLLVNALNSPRDPFQDS